MTSFRATVLLLAVLGSGGHAADEGTVDAWPCWNGPHGSGSAGTPSRALRSDPQLVWTSDAWIPPSGLNPFGKWVTSFAGPVVADGKVYQFFSIGSGDELPVDGEFARYAEEIGRRCKGGDDASLLRDDIVVCIDADTGETLWRTVMARAGVNLQSTGSGKIGGLHALALADGHVYGIGSCWQLFCLNGEDGELVWTAGVGGRHAGYEAARRAVIAAAEKDPAMARGDLKARMAELGLAGNPVTRGSRYQLPCGYPMAVDGVVAVDDHRDYHGYHAATGEHLWTVEHVAGSIHFPIRWRHRERGYFITGGKLTLIEARTGRICWQEEIGVDRVPAVAGDRLVVATDDAIRAFRISPEACEPLWSWDVMEGVETTGRKVSGGVTFAGITIHDGHVYANCKNPGQEHRDPPLPANDICGDHRARMVCLDLESGELVGEIRARGICMPTIGLGDMLIAEVAHAGDNLGLMRAAPEFDWVARAGIEYEDSTALAIVGTRLFVRCVDAIRCYELAR